jgi:transcriptional regulator with PAS, ATPase and Fis domain
LKACLAEVRSLKASALSPGLQGGERLIGRSAAISEVRSQITRIAATDCNVLITGETGTGKELAAELIHGNSGRSQGRFVCVNCAAIPEALFESELFGYERGAFTGAHSMRPGQLEFADKGVLFLDEIGEMNLHAQAKILRAIEGKEIQRLGRQTGVKVNVRIICATNRDLESEVEKGTFRADLFFRLNVARLKLPPLRERKEDLHGLGEHFLHDLNEKMGLSVCDFTEHSWRSLLRHSWPGNVREFKNVVEASLVRLPYPRMRLAELPEEFHRQFGGSHMAPTESEKLLAALVCHNWNKSKAAQELRWSRMTLYRKMAKYQLASAGHGTKTA